MTELSDLEELRDGQNVEYGTMEVMGSEDGLQIETADGVVSLANDEIAALAALSGQVSFPRPKMYLAYNGRAWGKGFRDTDAVANFAHEHGEGNVPDPVRMTLVEGRGDVWTAQRGTMVELRGDEILRATEYQIPREKFGELQAAVFDDRTAVVADDMLAGAEREEIDVDG